VLTMFEAAEDAVDRGTPEDLSHALTSCGRIIKGLADALYPATGESITGADGRDRAMTEDAYNNRLLQFAIENMEGSTHKGLVAETLRGLGNRLNRLNELSSKGVHDVVSSAEAETCLMWTYLTVADLLRIADGTSSRLQGETALSDKYVAPPRRPVLEVLPQFRVVAHGERARTAGSFHGGLTTDGEGYPVAVTIEVYHQDEQWHVRRQGEREPLSNHATKDDAVACRARGSRA